MVLIFNKNELIPILKYINQNDYMTIFKLYPELNEMCYSSFNYINIKITELDYAKYLIQNNILKIFPNIHEIIINVSCKFGWCCVHFKRLYLFYINIKSKLINKNIKIKIKICENVILENRDKTIIIKTLDIMEKFKNDLIIQNLYLLYNFHYNIDFSKYKYIKPEIVNTCKLSCVIDFSKNKKYAVYYTHPVYSFIIDQNNINTFYFHKYKNETYCYPLINKNENINKHKFYYYYLWHIPLFPTYYHLFKIRKLHNEINEDVNRILKIKCRSSYYTNYYEISNKLSIIYNINQNYIYYYLFVSLEGRSFNNFRLDISKTLSKYEPTNMFDLIDYNYTIFKYNILVCNLNKIFEMKHLNE